jgi:hypothetical protein
MSLNTRSPISQANTTTLTPCVYIAMRCPHCGELRLALATAPNSGEIACPLCAKLCVFVLLGAGLTTTPLPFHELQSSARLRCWIAHLAPTDCS